MTELEGRMAQLSARFAARAPEERAALADALENADCTALADRAHKLAGIAGMLGHPGISDAALALEEALISGRDYRPLATELLARLSSL